MALFKKAPARGVFDAKKAARFLGVAENDIVRAIEEQALPARKLGGRWLIARDALVRWLEADTLPAAPVPPEVDEPQAEIEPVQEIAPAEPEAVEPATVEPPPRPRLPLLLTAFNLRHLPANALWAL